MRFRKLLTRFSGALAVTAMVGGSAWAASTPIEHVVVIFQENVSFDHYFATYPIAKNSDGTTFNAAKGTPSVNGLTDGSGLTGSLLTANPNFDGAHGNPFRLGFSAAATCDQDHDYQAEQEAFDAGLMDMFLKFTNVGSCATVGGYDGSIGHPDDLVMGYYDGNTTTALWNYAQHFAMNDNSYGTTFGPSSPGAINVVSGYTGLAVQDNASFIDVTDGALTDDAQPFGDTCTTRDSAHLTGKNIGDLLNAANLTWGWFEGGFNLSATNPNGTTGCARSHTSITGHFGPKGDYIPHHEPFQYYASTQNLTHARPTGVSMIGKTDAANHQYDSSDFFDALEAGNLPAVVFLKAPGYQDGHAGYSSPLDEQPFIVDTINLLEASKFWNSTAVIISYDDSDGWYDHQMGPIIIHSQATSNNGGDSDALTGSGMCGSSSVGLQAQGRCGYGPRLPFIVVSPWAKTNYVDHTVTDQTSPIAFIEKNFGLSGPIVPASAGDAGSYEQYAGSIMNMFDFTQKKGAVKSHVVFVDPTSGNVLKKKPKSISRP
jgi:phospholipase C